MGEMKTLNGYEIVDEKARERIMTLEQDVDTKISKVSPKTYAQVFYQYTDEKTGEEKTGGWKINGSSGLVTNNTWGVPRNNYAELKNAVKAGHDITDFSAPCGYVDDKTASYQHHVTFRCFLIDGSGGRVQVEFIEFYTPPLRISECITLENFSEILSGITSIGSYKEKGVGMINVDDNSLYFYLTTENGYEFWTLYIPAEDDPTDDISWELTDIVTEIKGV